MIAARNFYTRLVPNASTRPQKLEVSLDLDELVMSRLRVEDFCSVSDSHGLDRILDCSRVKMRRCLHYRRLGRLWLVVLFSPHGAINNAALEA